MNDYSELERLAEEAIRQCDDGGKFAAALRNMQRYAGPTEVLAMIAENKRLEEDRQRIRQQRMDYARKNEALYDQVDQLKAELESVQPYFEDVERLCKVLGYLGVSTPGGGEEQAARWLSLVRTMIRTAETSKLLRHDAEKIAEYERIKAENDALGSAATAAASDLRKAADWICRKVEAGTESATHWAIRLGDNARALDAAMSKRAQSRAT